MHLRRLPSGRLPVKKPSNCPRGTYVSKCIFSTEIRVRSKDRRTSFGASCFTSFGWGLFSSGSPFGVFLQHTLGEYARVAVTGKRVSEQSNSRRKSTTDPSWAREEAWGKTKFRGSKAD